MKLIEQFKKAVIGAVIEYLEEVYDVVDVASAKEVPTIRKLPCIEIMKIIRRDDVDAIDMKRLIRFQLDQLKDTGYIKTGRSRLRRKVNKVLNDEKYSDYELIKEAYTYLRLDLKQKNELIKKLEARIVVQEKSNIAPANVSSVEEITIVENTVNPNTFFAKRDSVDLMSELVNELHELADTDIFKELFHYEMR